jgi:hypothetical protein
MKAISTFLLIFVSISIFAQVKVYNVKSGKISYSYEINEDINMSYTIVFDNYGGKQAVIIESKSGDVSEKTRTVITSEKMHIINYDDKQVMIIPVNIDDEDMQQAYMGDSENFSLIGLAADIEKSGAIIIGNETVLNKACKIYKFTDGEINGKFWIYKNYVLKAEFIEADGSHVFIQVTDFKLDIPVSSSEFEIPQNFTKTDMSKTIEQIKQMQQMYGIPDDE